MKSQTHTHTQRDKQIPQISITHTYLSAIRDIFIYIYLTSHHSQATIYLQYDIRG